MTTTTPTGSSPCSAAREQLVEQARPSCSSRRAAPTRPRIAQTRPVGADRPPVLLARQRARHPRRRTCSRQLGRPELTQRWVRCDHGRPSTATAPPAWPATTTAAPCRPGTSSPRSGFYPIVGSDRYVLSIPQFPKVELSVRGGVFTIEAVTTSGEPAAALLATGYVQRATLDGRPLAGPELRHADLKPGSTLRFIIGPDAVSWAQPSP